MKRNHTAPIHFSPRDAHGTTSGTPTGARAAGDVGPYHAPRHVRTRTPRPHTRAMRVPGRARRPRRAAPTGRHRERPRARGPPGRRPLPRSTPRPLVGRDVLGAPLPTERHRERGPPGRRPLPRTAPHPHTHIARRTRTPRPHTHAMRAPGRARRPRCAVAHENAIGDTHGHAGRRGRRPLPRSTPHPHGRARRPRRAVAHGTPSGTPTGTRAAGDVGPYHAPRHVRTRTARAYLVSGSRP